MEQQRLRLEGRWPPSAKERTEDYDVPGTLEGDGIQARIRRMRASVFLGRGPSPILQKGQTEVKEAPTPTHLGSQRPKQGGEAAQAADGFIHMQLQGLRWLGGVGQQSLALQDGF